VFADRKTYKRLDQSYQEAMKAGLGDLGEHVKRDTGDLIAGNEVLVGDDPALVTGPAGVASGEFEPTSWGWLVLTSKRLNFRRLDGDGVQVRVAFVDDLGLDATEGPFDTYKWQDRAQLRVISFGFLKQSSIRSELRSRAKS
jgi:hypothetical protein